MNRAHSSWSRTGSRKRPKRPESKSENRPNHAFWSGSLSFGLVSVPVFVFPATRNSKIHLRLLSPNGSFLERRFYCPRQEKEVAGDEIVRGYELENGSYVLVEDRELEALEPQKSREIDLRQFVALDELPPMLLERGYYLTPREGTTKAYRLLAEAMERQGRAGIATFVMREREYLVAIFAKDGILCAETLRFRDEIRDPATIGLPEPPSAPRKQVAAFERSIAALSARTVSQADLTDKSTESLRALIEKKRKAGRDIVRTDKEEAAAALSDNGDGEDAGDVDLLETIRRSLRQTRSRSVERYRESPSRSRVRKSGRNSR